MSSESFAYKGISAGKYVEGTIDAINQEEASFKLKEQKIIITNLVRTKKKVEKKMEDRKVLVNKLLPRWFRYLENLLLEDDSTWFVEKMTIADIAIWRLLGWPTTFYVINSYIR